MPKEMTHWWVARKAEESLSPESVLGAAIHSYRQLFMMGAVVPDMPFYFLFGPRSGEIKRIAERFHNSENGSYRLFEGLMPWVGGERRSAGLALLSGLLTHIHTDSIFHPMVYYFCGRGEADFRKKRFSLARHRTLETLADMFVRHLSPDKEMRVAKMVKGLEIDREHFLDMLASVFSPFGEVRPSLMRRLLFFQGRIQGLLFRDIFRRGLERTSLLTGIDLGYLYANFYPKPAPAEKILFKKPIRVIKT